jgi:transcriptional regulator with XRE-family HTH domain
MLAKKKPDPTDKYVGARVRMRRMMLGMTQQKLGDALGLTFQQIQKYEKGANRVSSSRLQQIAHILQVPVSYFFDGGPNASGTQRKTFSRAPSANDLAEFLATPDGFALCKAFMSINEAKVRRRIVDLVEKLNEQSI